jgi:hypothetical protein
MKPSVNSIRNLMTLLFIVAGSSAMAQHQQMQYFRPTDKDGLNVFETTTRLHSIG